MMIKKICLCVSVLVMLFIVSGCSSSSNPDASLHMTVASAYVPDTMNQELDELLRAALPELYTESQQIVVNCISTGNSETDPTTTMAGMTQIMGMMASGEVELLICTGENARRYGDNGNAFMPVSELFTESELTASGLQPVSVPVLDEEGNPTGENSVPCGIDLSGSSQLTSALYHDDIAAYVLVNTSHIENAKDVITLLASNP